MLFDLAPDFATSSFGCQFLTEVLLGAEGDKVAALAAVANLAAGDPRPENEAHIANSAAGCRMLKSLVQGGRFDAKAKKVVPVEPQLGFAELLWEQVKGRVVEWATGPGAFVVVALVEADGWEGEKEVSGALKGQRKALERAAGDRLDGDDKGAKKRKNRKGGKGEEELKGKRGNAGARLLLQKLG